MRRLVVTLLVGTAAAAVTAGVALNEHRPGEAALQSAAAGALGGDAAAAGAQPVRTRRDQWRDPWKRAPLAESAPTWTSASPAEAAAIDASLPSAAEALKGASVAAGEDAPTF